MSCKLLAVLAAGLLLVTPVAPVAAQGVGAAPPVAPVAAQDAGAAPPVAPVVAPLVVPTFTVDQTNLHNGGVITVTGQAAPGKPVFIEVFNENFVTGSFFDSRRDPQTGEIPWRLYMSRGIPAHYRIHMPRDRQPILDRFIAEGRPWSYSRALAETGGALVYRHPAKHPITTFQASLGASIVGSRGEVLPPLDAREQRRRSMQIMRARFREVDRLLEANIDQKADGSFTAQMTIPSGSPPGRYFITVATGAEEVSETVAAFENEIVFPMRYMSNAGTSMNLFVPFLLVLGLATFGVMMGAGGGFLITPILLLLFPLPHAVVAGSVTPTVLFSQASGVVNYSRIKFISWKVGITLGIAMLAGGFIGPVLTTMVSLHEFMFIFGWILFILAALMFWQTTPGYLAKNAKETAILKEFQKRAEAAAAAKAAKAAKV